MSSADKSALELEAEREKEREKERIRGKYEVTEKKLVEELRAQMEAKKRALEDRLRKKKEKAEAKGPGAELSSDADEKEAQTEVCSISNCVWLIGLMFGLGLRLGLGLILGSGLSTCQTVIRYRVFYFITVISRLE